MSDSRFEERQNRKEFKFNFKRSKSLIDTNCEYVTEEKYKEMFQETQVFNPFLDFGNRKLVKVKNTITKIKLGIDTFRKDNGFVERNILSTRKYAGFDSLDDIVDYPFSFNYDNFFTLTNRLDVFSNVSKIQMNQTYIDNLKGFKSNSLGNSKNSFGEILRIDDKTEKIDDTVSHYEDDIISSFIHSEKDKIVIDKIIKSVNPISGITTNTVITKKKNIISSEVRYFAYKEQKVNPFFDRTQKVNNHQIDSKQNRYKFTSESINNKILSIRDKNKAIKESTLYSSRGIDCDYSLSNGIDSLAYYGRID